jgi:phosphoserine phosphatase RsbU/P
MTPQTSAPPKRGRIRDFWHRVSEGQQVDEMWKQFTADARASYGFYGKDVDWEEANRRRGLRRIFHVIKQFFWALLLKLSPARRVLLLAALVMLVVSNVKVGEGRDQTTLQIDFIAAIVLLFLLSLELADKVVMKRDLEIAREIQTWLVPSRPPEVPGGDIAFATRPQNSVAGDYYDAFYPTLSAAEGGKLMLVIADVAGKSVPAALLMATMQASLHTIAGENAPLADLVTRLNHYASAHSLDGMRFTTAILGLYDPTTRRLDYVNAGHNVPVLRRTNGTLEKLEAGGVPLGIHSASTYTMDSVDLRPGDVLILYTDGVVEAFNHAGEEFGNERWFSVIRGLPQGSAQQSLQYLMGHVDAFVGTTRQSDDITCLIFRCS